jgi:hypothetical protein
MLDADMLIANERGIFDLKGWLSSLPDEQLDLAAITVAELWHGLERAREPYRAHRQVYIESMVNVHGDSVYDRNGGDSCAHLGPA